jgi:hypothetical protein
MKIEAKTIRVQGALHGLNEAADQVIVQIDDLLVTIAEKALWQIPDGVLTALGSGGIGRVVATKVAVDNAWTVDSVSKRILLPRAGHIERIDPLEQDVGQDVTDKIGIEGLPAGTFGASAEPGGNRILFLVVRDVNLDFAEYAVAVADLMLGRMITEKSVRSNDDLLLVWDAASRGWVISDTGKGIVWRWDGERPAVRSASSVEPSSGRKHPSQDLWASVEQAGAAQRIQIRDSSRKVIAETALRPGTQVRNLVWSTSSPERLWGLGIRALVEMMLNN